MNELIERLLEARRLLLKSTPYIEYHYERSRFGEAQKKLLDDIEKFINHEVFKEADKWK